MKRDRCKQCVEKDSRYCPHENVLVVYVGGIRIVIVSPDEDSARKTANKLRMKMKGAPFHPLKHPIDIPNHFIRTQ